MVPRPALGDPANLGWIATTPSGTFVDPLYLCRWSASGVTEEFLHTNRTECASAGGTLLADPLGYVDKP